MIKLTTLNNKLYMHVIDEENLNDIYISYTQMYNLIINENTAITIKKAIPENNEKNFKARNEVIAKIRKAKNTYFLKIGIGKDFKPIQSIEDIDKSWEIKIENYNDIKNFIVQDFEKFELYEDLRKQLKQKNSLIKNKKNIEDF